MRVDMITMHAIMNYGSVLQAFATQEILRSVGLDVVVINYVRSDVRGKELFRVWCGNDIIKKMVMLPTVKRWKKIFTTFTKKYLNLTKQIYTSADDFRRYPIIADMYCTGSDQVWNSGWNSGIEKALYLNFVPHDKFKFAFAASFGRDCITTEEVVLTKKYIEQYNMISVREKSGVEILDKQYGYKRAINLVDPTLALSPEFWRQYEGKRIVKGEYILIYNLNRSREFDNYAVNLSKRTGLEIIRICTRYDQFHRPGKCLFIPTVFDFINLIDNAKYVLTDSFHATAFSMNLNTEPICIYPKVYEGRLQNLLELTRSVHRKIEGYEDFDIVNRPVDFAVVNHILLKERERVYDFIKEVVNVAETMA